MKKTIYLVAVALCTILISCGESPEDYNKRAFAVADSISSSAEICFYMASDRQSTWRKLIFDKYYNDVYYGDWQDGIIAYNEDNSIMFSAIKSRRETIDSLYKTIKEFPDKSSDIHSHIKDLYLVYNTAYDMSLSSTGYSLQEYTSLLNDVYEKYKTKTAEIKLEK